MMAHAKLKRGGGWQALVPVIGEIGIGAFLGCGIKEITEEVQKKKKEQED
jgi:hypothetical protein